MAKTFAQIQKQIQALREQGEKLRKRETAGVVAKIKTAIEAYNITPSDLFGGKGRGRGKTSSKGPSGSTSGAKYRDANGNVWGGRGPRPQWLRDALSAGETLEHFLASGGDAKGVVEQDKSAAPKAKKKGRPAGKKNSTKASAKTAARFTDGTNVWSGRGPRPAWFKAALSGGKTLAELRAP